jgi:large subunit ribosomal protein L1
MGKTKTAFVSDTGSAEVSGKEAYEAKRKKKEEAEAKKKAQIAGLGLKGGERIKVVGGEIPTEIPNEERATTESTEKRTEGTEKKKPVKIKTHGKNYTSAKGKISRDKLYSLSDAIKLLKELKFSKFDETVELHLVVKKVGTSAQVTLPFSAGKAKMVEVADDKTLEKLKSGKLDFDILLATAEMMPKLVPFAKTLGPKGLMPNPKNGTLIKSAKEAEKFKGNSLGLRTEKDKPLVHTVVGKLSQKEEELLSNTQTILEGFAGSKQIIKAYMKSTMSPSIKLTL